MASIELSIIIVHYQIESALFECLESIEASKSMLSYEVIVVDNGSKNDFQKRLHHKFSKVVYIKSPRNMGYGGGNNLGAQSANSSILFFLNPDTKVLPGCIDQLYQHLLSHAQVGIVAPTLLHQDMSPFIQQGSLTLTPLRALASHSIIHRIWPNNLISNKFWLEGIDQKKDRRVEVIPGTAFMIRREDFFAIGAFDTAFFLYFEEYDLCKRMREEGKEIWMLGGARLIHSWEVTTKGLSLNHIYHQSFRRYLLKHYGKLFGEITYMLTQISSVHLLIIMLFFALLLYLVLTLLFTMFIAETFM